MAQNKRPSTSWLSIEALRNFLSKPAPQNGKPSLQYYLEDLVFQHRTFDVKGIAAPGEATLPLQDVFVDVGLGSTPQKASANPIPLMQKINREERLSIWRFLQQADARKPDNLVVLGAPGTGKTTLLKHLALSLAAPTQDAPRVNRVPIFLYLRDMAQQIQQNPNYSLRQGMQMLLTSRGVKAPLDWLAAELANGRCLIMLDGLDEVANLEQRQQVAAWVQRQMRQHPHNQFIITSRPFGYESNPLPQTLLLEVKPFTIEQIRQFVKNWYLATEVQTQRRSDVGVQRDATERAADLLQRLHQTPALLDMGINPLLLTMIATIHHYRSSLPDQRVALYHEICDVFLGKRQQARGITSELTPLQKKRVLQTLAFEMMRRNLRNIPRAQAADIIDPALKRVNPHSASLEFLRMIAETSGLLVEHTPGVYSFAHLTFQEYLTAVHIKEAQQEALLLNEVDNAWWHETIRLYVAQANATNIIRACVMRERASIPALTLAVECLDEALEVEDDFRKIPGELLRSIEDDNPEIRRIGAEVRLLLRLRNLVRLDETTYADNTLVTQAEYQLFLDEMRTQGRYLQPDHWQEMQFTKGAGQNPVAGVRPSDALAFCDWLSERHPGPWRYRLPTAQEIKRPPLNSLDSAEDSSIGYWFQRNGRPELAPAPRLRQDKMLVETLQRKLKEKLLNDLLAFRNITENDEEVKQLQTVILQHAKQRAFSLLDLERRLPFAENGGEEIGRYFSRVQDRTTEGMATEIEQGLITAKAYVDHPNLVFAKSPLLEEIIEMSNRLLQSLDNLVFPDKMAKLMHQLMRDLGRAREIAQHNRQSEFLSHRELVRHINSAFATSQILLDELVRCRLDARFRLRMSALRHSLGLLQRHSNRPVDESTRPRLDRLKILQVMVDLYVDMAILESRDGNKTEATEGIRIIREAALT
ncbi:MAG: NACHT domain-containing protein [Ardenticatenaceae bacterium]|nr:NACHT domain-containing protein [Ardenticatenaceae bacterium]